MKISELIYKHREFILRCLCLTGIKVIVPLSNTNGLFKLSAVDIEEQEISEIHILDGAYDGIYDLLSAIGFSLKARIGKFQIYVPNDEILNGEKFRGYFLPGDLVIVNGERYSGEKALIFISNAHLRYCVLITETGKIFDIQGEKNALDRLIYLSTPIIEDMPDNANHAKTMFNLGMLNDIF